MPCPIKLPGFSDVIKWGEPKQILSILVKHSCPTANQIDTFVHTLSHLLNLLLVATLDLFKFFDCKQDAAEERTPNVLISLYLLYFCLLQLMRPFKDYLLVLVSRFTSHFCILRSKLDVQQELRPVI